MLNIPPQEYRQALALARKEEALREERRKETEAVRQPSSSNITDPISLPPMPASTSKVQEKSDTPATASLSPTSTPQPVSIEPKGPSAASAPLQRIPSQQAAQPGKPSPAPAAATEAKSKSNAIVIDSDSDTDDDEVAVTSGPSKSTSKPAIPTRSPPPAAVLPKSSTSKVSPASAPGRVSEPAPAEASTSAASLRDTVAKMPVSQLPTSTWGFESFVGSSHQSGEDDEVLKVKAEVAALAADALPKYSFVVA